MARSRTRTAVPTLAVGLDVGYAAVKVMTSQGDRWLLPTAVAPVDLDVLELPSGNGAAPSAATQTVPSTVTLPDGSRYLLGTAAIWSGRRLKDHLTWDQWWQSIPYQVLLQALRVVIPPRAVIVTGLPLHLASLADVRQHLAQVCQQVLSAAQVVVLPQGVAAAFALGLDRSPQHVAIIDIGGGRRNA
jgi:hypothetical protein